MWINCEFDLRKKHKVMPSLKKKKNLEKRMWIKSEFISPEHRTKLTSIQKAN